MVASGGLMGGGTGHVLSLCVLHRFASLFVLQAMTFPYQLLPPSIFPSLQKYHTSTATRLQPLHGLVSGGAQQLKIVALD